MGFEDVDIIATIDKDGVILQRELNLFLGFRVDNIRSMIDKDGVVRRRRLFATGAQLAELIDFPDWALSRLTLR